MVVYILLYIVDAGVPVRIIFVSIFEDCAPIAIYIVILLRSTFVVSFLLICLHGEDFSLPSAVAS